jgi:hypothetical protein
MIMRRFAMIAIRHKPIPFFYVLLLGLGVLLSNGCGRKAPPAAPKEPSMPAVTDLSAVHDNRRIYLKWHHPGMLSPTVGYVVLQAQRALSEPDCPECPLVFERVGTQNLQRTLREQRHALSFNVPVTKGAVYHYKVVPFQSSGAQGPDSNLVKVEVQTE